MIHINPYVQNIKPYTVASHKIWAVSPEERAGILKLDWNEASVDPSPKVMAALKELMAQGDFFRLYPSTFNEELMDAISEYTGMPRENLQYFGSSDSLHEYIARTYLGEGTKVLVLWPSYDNFRLTAESSGAKLYFSEMDENFVFSAQKLAADLKAVKPELCYVCNPNNPTGTLIGKDVIRDLLDRFPDTVFLIDEAYTEFAGDASVKELTLNHENLLVTRTLSKAFGLANMRFGYLIASSANIEVISRIRNPKNITTFTQVAAAAALRDAGYMRGFAKEVEEGRRHFIDTVNRTELDAKLQAFESKGNFVLLRCQSAEIKAALIAHYEADNIFVRNVSQSASLANCIRITVGTKAQMERVIRSTMLAFEREII